MVAMLGCFMAFTQVGLYADRSANEPGLAEQKSSPKLANDRTGPASAVGSSQHRLRPWFGEGYGAEVAKRVESFRFGAQV